MFLIASVTIKEYLIWLHPSTPPSCNLRQAGLVGSAAAMSDDAEYQKALDALSSLISGKQRSDGRNWAHAFDMMKVYLEVGAGCPLNFLLGVLV